MFSRFFSFLTLIQVFTVSTATGEFSDVEVIMPSESNSAKVVIAQRKDTGERFLFTDENSDGTYDSIEIVGQRNRFRYFRFENDVFRILQVVSKHKAGAIEATYFFDDPSMKYKLYESTYTRGNTFFNSPQTRKRFDIDMIDVGTKGDGALFHSGEEKYPWQIKINSYDSIRSEYEKLSPTERYKRLEYLVDESCSGDLKKTVVKALEQIFYPDQSVPNAKYLECLDSLASGETLSYASRRTGVPPFHKSLYHSWLANNFRSDMLFAEKARSSKISGSFRKIRCTDIKGADWTGKDHFHRAGMYKSVDHRLGHGYVALDRKTFGSKTVPFKNKVDIVFHEMIHMHGAAFNEKKVEFINQCCNGKEDKRSFKGVGKECADTEYQDPEANSCRKTYCLALRDQQRLIFDEGRSRKFKLHEKFGRVTDLDRELYGEIKPGDSVDRSLMAHRERVYKQVTEGFDGNLNPSNDVAEILRKESDEILKVFQKMAACDEKDKACFKKARSGFKIARDNINRHCVETLGRDPERFGKEGRLSSQSVCDRVSALSKQQIDYYRYRTCSGESLLTRRCGKGESFYKRSCRQQRKSGGKLPCLGEAGRMITKQIRSDSLNLVDEVKDIRTMPSIDNFFKKLTAEENEKARFELTLDLIGFKTLFGKEMEQLSALLEPARGVSGHSHRKPLSSGEFLAMNFIKGVRATCKGHVGNDEEHRRCVKTFNASFFGGHQVEKKYSAHTNCLRFMAGWQENSERICKGMGHLIDKVVVDKKVKVGDTEVSGFKVLTSDISARLQLDDCSKAKFDSCYHTGMERRKLCDGLDGKLYNEAFAKEKIIKGYARCTVPHTTMEYLRRLAERTYKGLDDRNVARGESFPREEIRRDTEDIVAGDRPRGGERERPKVLKPDERIEVAGRMPKAENPTRTRPPERRPADGSPDFQPEPDTNRDIGRKRSYRREQQFDDEARTRNIANNFEHPKQNFKGNGGGGFVSPPSLTSNVSQGGFTGSNIGQSYDRFDPPENFSSNDLRRQLSRPISRVKSGQPKLRGRGQVPLNEQLKKIAGKFDSRSSKKIIKDLTAGVGGVLKDAAGSLARGAITLPPAVAKAVNSKGGAPAPVFVEAEDKGPTKLAKAKKNYKCVQFDGAGRKKLSKNIKILKDFEKDPMRARIFSRLVYRNECQKEFRSTGHNILVINTDFKRGSKKRIVMQPKGGKSAADITIVFSKKKVRVFEGYYRGL